MLGESSQWTPHGDTNRRNKKTRKGHKNVTTEDSVKKKQ